MVIRLPFFLLVDRKGHKRVYLGDTKVILGPTKAFIKIWD